MQAESTIGLKSINDLLKGKYIFFVPSYQRGYRWSNQQIEELLEDIWEFHLQNPGIDEFYCLQPVIVKARTNSGKAHWELIDGQQRLTTLYLILSYLKTLLPSISLNFTIEYETRNDSIEYLKNITTNTGESNSKQNIDNFYMYNAYQSIKTWFEGFDEVEKLTNAIEFTGRICKQVKIIWYCVTAEMDSIDIFTRINLGKIPLTDAELIKALFLRKDNFRSLLNEPISISQKQTEISREWDVIEQTLHNEEFWYFLTDGVQYYDTRIEFLLEMIAIAENDKLPERIKKEDKHFSFLVFNQLFMCSKNDGNNELYEIEKIWGVISGYYNTFYEWFTRNDLYHLVGYLISTGSRISKIKKDADSYNKYDLYNYLKSEIKKTVYINGGLDSLEYPTDRKIIKNVLLLFNILSIYYVKKSNYRFPFDQFKREEWDIEHVHSLISSPPSAIYAQKLWLETLMQQLEDKQICEEAKLLLIDDDMHSKFEEFFIRVSDTYSEIEEEKINWIGNLVLLDSSTNRSYKNAIFPIKRKLIIERDRNNVFIPPCTKNVFLKFYSTESISNNKWSIDDQEAYYEILDRILNKFLSEGEMNGKF